MFTLGTTISGFVYLEIVIFEEGILLYMESVRTWVICWFGNKHGLIKVEQAIVGVYGLKHGWTGKQGGGRILHGEIGKQMGYGGAMGIF